MNTLFRKLTAFVIVFSFVSSAFAGSIFVSPGPKAKGMGAAFVSVADDASAIYWNPAGLTQLKGSGVDVSAISGAGQSTSNTSLGNAIAPDRNNGDFPLPNLYSYIAAINPLAAAAGFGSVEPALYSNKTLTTGAILPFAAGYTKINDMTLAFGFYAAGGGGGKWDDTVAGGVVPTDSLTASIDSSYGFLNTNISAAREIAQKLSLGIGVNWINMFDKARVKKAYSTSAAGAAIGLKDYSLDLDQSSTGSGYEVTAGLMYEPVERLKTGLVFRSGSKIALNGTAKATTTGLPALAGLPDLSSQTDYTQYYYYPMTYALGASYQTTDKLLLSFDLNAEDYTQMKDEIDYKSPVSLSTLPVLADTNVSKDWKMIYIVRIGANYAVNDNLALRGGVNYDPSPDPNTALTFLKTNQYTNTYACVGAGYNLNGIQLDFSYLYGLPNKIERNGVTYEYPASSFQLGAGYRF